MKALRIEGLRFKKHQELMALLKEGIDFNYDHLGRMVLTKEYHLKRGYCCQSGCLNCPYGFTDKADPSYPAELQNIWPEDEASFYEDPADQDESDD